MLTRDHRLTSSRLFGDTVRRGQRAGTTTVVLHFRAARTEPQTSDRAHDWAHDWAGPTAAQVGFVVSKAVGPAVTRNLVKRRLRHLVRDRVLQLPGSSVLVVRALPAAAGAPYATLSADLDAALRRALAKVGR